MALFEMDQGGNRMLIVRGIERKLHVDEQKDRVTRSSCLRRPIP